MGMESICTSRRKKECRQEAVGTGNAFLLLNFEVLVIVLLHDPFSGLNVLKK